MRLRVDQVRRRIDQTITAFKNRIRQIEVSVGVVVDSTGGVHIASEPLRHILFRQDVGGGDRGNNAVISRLDDFESPFANIRAKAFLELITQGERILDDLKNAILTFELDLNDAASQYSLKFQYLSQLFVTLPTDPYLKLEICQSEFEPARKYLLNWGPTKARIFGPELAYLAVKEGAKPEVKDLFLRAVKDKKFNYDFHLGVINAIHTMNNETAIAMLLEVLTYPDLPEYMPNLVFYALGAMFSRNVTPERKRAFGIPQLSDIVGPEFLTGQPRPGYKPLDVRYINKIDPFQEASIYKSEQPKPELIKKVTERIIGFIQEQGKNEDHFLICASLIDVLETRLIFLGEEYGEGLSMLLEDPNLYGGIKFRVHSVLKSRVPSDSST